VAVEDIRNGKKLIKKRVFRIFGIHWLNPLRDLLLQQPLHKWGIWAIK
jgi:hypothetical protein